jgi:hypothetical protein
MLFSCLLADVGGGLADELEGPAMSWPVSSAYSTMSRSRVASSLGKLDLGRASHVVAEALVQILRGLEVHGAAAEEG